MDNNKPHSLAMQWAYDGMRQVLTAMLAQCTEAQQDIFRRMYPEGIAGLSVERLDWACRQVEVTIEKNRAAQPKGQP